MKTVYIENFKNNINYTQEGRRNIYLPLLEVKIRNAVIERFRFDGSLRIADSAEKASLVLKGELLNYERTELRTLENDDVQEYRITITVSLELFDTEKQEIAWAEPSFSGDSSYFVTGPTAKSEEQAIQDAMTDLARRIVERTIENW